MKTFFKLFLILLFILIISLGFIGYNRFQLPSTAKMEEFFVAHQSGFEQKNTVIISALEQKIEIDSGVNRQVNYQWLKILPSLDSYQEGDPVAVLYYTHLRGIGVGSFGTGIAYIDPKKQEKTYPTLESMSADAARIEGFIGYCHISGNWYSFVWEAD